MTKLLVSLILLASAGTASACAIQSEVFPKAGDLQPGAPEAAAGQKETELSQSEIEALGRKALERARSDVRKFGWHMVAVPGEGGAPGHIFTIGLWKSYHHPELLLFFPGDPQKVAGRVSALAKRIAGGEVFLGGKTYDGLFGTLPGGLRKVRSEWYGAFLGTALGFYQTDDFPVLQMLWPDGAGLFPWQSGFDPDLFAAQPLLSESNLVLANVSSEAREWLVEDLGPEALRTSWGELFVDLPSDYRDHALDDWRWLVGPDAKLFRVTLFGDLFLQTPDGHIHWLDAGFGAYEEVAQNEAEWLEVLAINLPTIFHASTLLALRDLGYRPKPGEVYSWRHAPILGGQEEVANFERVSAAVHISYLGGLHHKLKVVPPGTKITDYDFTPLGPAGSDTTDPALRYQVVINPEEQYSIWPEGEEVPEGWKPVEKVGTKQECFDYIKTVWLDMRPLSLRKAMEAQEKEKLKEQP